MTPHTDETRALYDRARALIETFSTNGRHLAHYDRARFDVLTYEDAVSVWVDLTPLSAAYSLFQADPRGVAHQRCSPAELERLLYAVESEQINQALASETEAAA